MDHKSTQELPHNYVGNVNLSAPLFIINNLKQTKNGKQKYTLFFSC